MIRLHRNRKTNLIELDPRPRRRISRLSGLMVALALIGAGAYQLAIWLLSLIFGV